MITSYFKYLLRSGNEHSIHSPFLFELYTNVIKEKGEQHPDYSSLKLLRKELRSSKEQIEILDLGAGSRVNKSNLRKVRTIAKNAEKPEKFGRLFHRLIRHFQPESILELGTSLGLTTLFMAKAKPESQILSFEGCPETAKIAKRNFDKSNVSNIEVILGNIDETLPETLKKLDNGLDYAYFDANHRYEPTVRYFEQCLPYAKNDSLFIFDDIYWSDEMTQAWEHIKAHPQVTLTVDLFWIGLVFFRKEQVKEDFVLRF
ncbi:Methyltransferase domain-containing protein [Dyadobacter koreensis]|uniref:Methyltransferase domain-containing protein n=1 Tax=Dyadobacter koreensis TaxID=408657 RepID=A0A1H6VG35_9BACT|nr:class I SAM-dependent methyltransferase [Dyadobacter koreensis]SEI99175.1 Methyltransferase domain-containing protein [Dyadobacter koreensis]